MDKVKIDGKEYRGDIIPLKTSVVLLIQGGNGMLGCGYLSTETADKLGHALAIVTGVATYDDMLVAKVARMSAAAAAMGVKVGMTGKEALILMC